MIKETKPSMYLIKQVAKNLILFPLGLIFSKLKKYSKGHDQQLPQFFLNQILLVPVWLQY